MDTDEIKFGFMQLSRTDNVIFILRQLQEKYLAKKDELVLCMCRFWKKLLI